MIFSHSSTRGLVDHKRNVPDSILTRLPRNGGVVMVTFVPGFISRTVQEADRVQDSVMANLAREIADTAERRRRQREYRAAHPLPNATIDDVADHIEYVRRVAGVDHVGLGSDFDGIEYGPDGLEDVSTFPALFAVLIRRGWSDADLRKLAGENLLRALRQAEATAKRLQATRPPSTATIGELDGVASKVPSTEYRVPSTEYRVPSTEFRVPSTIPGRGLRSDDAARREGPLTTGQPPQPVP